ncbi:MAG TPA: hypothetical protein VGV67_03040 [Solirubrobacteraceae bacterium]|nr:hypothetical protein [Solirubrobacteraceae bacterium]
MIAALLARLRELEVATRPEHPDLQAALAARWAELPAHVKQPNQMLGRRMTGCEGTHGVFPRCNLACTPCYHAREANRVRTDGDHTEREVDRQMALLRELRGPGQHAQLIGGEVTLLGPEDHARALLAMRRHGRKPMSMTHGDFDYAYLEALAVDPDSGRPRFSHLAFGGHFDSLMFGRRGISRVRGEAELNPYRERFCAMFERLRHEHGVTHYLAHNMTVAPRNLDAVAGVVRDCRDMGFRMFSFQPAAYIGNEARWREEFRAVSADEVWRRIEQGAGARLHFNAERVGDVRCNRTAHGVYTGGGYATLLDEDDARDARALEDFILAFGGMDFDEPRRALLAARAARAIARHPAVLPSGTAWAARLLRRMGGARSIARHRPRPMTYVMHSFMDARDVKPAWELLQRGELSADPAIRATQERLQACSYAMAHPDRGTLVPACAQHAVLDPLENLRLQELLPLRTRGH